MLIIYRDVGEGIKNGKLLNSSLHRFSQLYTSLVGFYVNYSLHTPILFYAWFSSTALSYYHKYPFTIITVYSTMNINLCRIVYSLLHGVLIIINRHGSPNLDWSNFIQTHFIEVTLISQIKIISAPQQNKDHLEEMMYVHKAINYTDNAQVLRLLCH